jgi:predicted permease
MTALRSDVRHAVGALVRTKATSFAAFLTLALGLGLTTALIAVFDGVLVRPLPFSDSEQLVLVSEHRPGATGGIGGVISGATANAWSGARTIEGPAGYSEVGFVWATPDGADRIEAAKVSPQLFPILRVAPHRGRFFHQSEENEGRDAAVILSYGLWRERFGGRDDAIGARLRLDDREYEVVGIAPPGFGFPGAARLWTPLTRLPLGDPAKPQIRIFRAIGRLRPNVTPDQAAAEGTAAARSYPRSFVDDLIFGKGGPSEVRVVRMLDDAVSEVKPALLAVAAGVALLLLVACANVANLLLASGVARRRELAVRAALGASGRQLLRLLLIEHTLLAVAGLAGGWLLALLVVDALPVLAPVDFPRLHAVAITSRIMAASGAAAALTVVLAGLLPAWRASRAPASLALKDDDGRSAGETSARLRTTLLVGEAALALVLVVAALLLARSVDRLRRIDPGYDAANVLTARLEVVGAADTADRRAALIGGILERIRALPGVRAAGASNMAPFGGSIYLSTFDLPGGGDGRPTRADATTFVVTPGFADALGLRLVAGRAITAADADGDGPVVVNETFARRYLRDGRPVAGRDFPVVIGRNAAPAGRIVGVIRDVRPDGPLSEPRPEVYLLAGARRPIEQTIHLAIRADGDPVRLVPALRDIVRTADGGVALHAVGTLAGRLSTAVATPRFFAIVIALFAGLALTLAAVGLYGVLSYAVTLRRRELGIRAALGASRSDLLRLVVRQGLGATAAGLAIGVPLSLAASRLMRSLLFGVEPTDIVSFAGAAAALLVVALAACLVPARRAAASDPSAALAAE